MSTPFERGLDEYVRRFTKAATDGLARAGFQCLADTVMDIPQVPLDEGTLRGSGSVFVNNKLISTSEEFAAQYPTAKPNPAKHFSEALSDKAIRGVVGFNTPYAARMHEGLEFEFQHSGTGAKFLEQKLLQHGNEYIEIVKDHIQQEVGNASAA